MTTIKLKNGSGAPAGGDLVQGEPALDLTNKRLYTEDSGGNVIEVGTNPGVDVTFADNRKALFGAGSDLQIYHTGTQNYIEDAGTGNLNFKSNGNFYNFLDGSNATVFQIDLDDATRLYHNTTQKLSTTSTGIDVTGTATMDGLTVSPSGTQQVLATLRANSGAGGGLVVQTDASDDGLIRGYDSAGNVQLQFDTDGGDNYIAKGNVGIGTSSFTSTASGRTVLEVNGSSTSALINLSVNGTRQGYIFTDTTDMNVYNVDSGSLNFGTNNTERMRIDASGNVSIGTSNSLGVLTIKSTASDDQDIITITEDGTNQAFSINGNFAGAGSTGNAITLDSYWADDIIVFRGDGNVGIGTSNPDTSLHISESSTATATVRLEQTDTTLVADQAVGVIEFEQNDAAGAGVPAKFGAFGENANAAVGLRFYTGTGATANERMRIDSSGNVGIGTDSPRNDANFKTLQIGDSSTAASQLVLDDNDSSGPWRIISNLSLIINDDTDERMRIDSSGNLYSQTTTLNVGTSSTETGMTHQAGQLQVSANGYQAAIFNRLQNGTIADFRVDGTVVGSIGSALGDSSVSTLFIADAGNVGIRFDQASTDDIQPCTSTGADRDDAINLGASGNRFKDLHMSGGVYLGGTSSANKLDDYEEGTWTPTLIGTVTNPTTSSLTIQGATYTKVGRTVHVQAYIVANITNVGAGDAQIGGLPFNVGTGYTPAVFKHGDLIESNGGYFNNGANQIIAIADFTTNGEPYAGTGIRGLMISGTYEVA